MDDALTKNPFAWANDEEGLPAFDAMCNYRMPPTEDRAYIPLHEVTYKLFEKMGHLNSRGVDQHVIYALTAHVHAIHAAKMLIMPVVYLRQWVLFFAERTTTPERWTLHWINPAGSLWSIVDAMFDKAIKRALNSRLIASTCAATTHRHAARVVYAGARERTLLLRWYIEERLLRYALVPGRVYVDIYEEVPYTALKW
jgi:hypothetical protein